MPKPYMQYRIGFELKSLIEKSIGELVQCMKVPIRPMSSFPRKRSRILLLLQNIRALDLGDQTKNTFNHFQSVYLLTLSYLVELV